MSCLPTYLCSLQTMLTLACIHSLPNQVSIPVLYVVIYYILAVRFPIQTMPESICFEIIRLPQFSVWKLALVWYSVWFHIKCWNLVIAILLRLMRLIMSSYEPAPYRSGVVPTLRICIAGGTGSGRTSVEYRSNKIFSFKHLFPLSLQVLSTQYSWRSCDMNALTSTFLYNSGCRHRRKTITISE